MVSARKLLVGSYIIFEFSLNTAEETLPNELQSDEYGSNKYSDKAAKTVFLDF